MTIGFFNYHETTYEVELSSCFRVSHLSKSIQWLENHIKRFGKRWRNLSLASYRKLNIIPSSFFSVDWFSHVNIK